METAVTFATSDVGKLNSIKDFIRSLDVSIIQEEDIPSEANLKTLLVYYSYTNNCERIIDDLKTQITCDVLEIEPKKKGLRYEANNYAIGMEQLNKINANPNDLNSYPKIDPVSMNLSQYDCILIAVPLWWSEMAAPMQSFLFQYGKQMTGKHIGMIVSSASSGISEVISRAKELIPEGKFLLPNLWIRSSQVSNCHALTAQWLQDINYANLQPTVSRRSPATVAL